MAKIIPLMAATLLFTACQPGSNKNDKRISITVVGDIMVHETQLVAAYNDDCSCFDFSDSFKYVTPYLQKTDLTLGNLETTLPGDFRKFAGYPQFGAPAALIKTLKKSGFDLLMTANNHSADKGETGIKNTIETLDQNHILHTGTFDKAREEIENRVLVHKVKGITIALLNYSYGTNGLEVPKGTTVNIINEKVIKEDLKAAAELNPDLTIVMYHFGGEYERKPNEYQKKFTKLAFDNGAQIVFGSHPHVLQKWEHFPGEAKEPSTDETEQTPAVGDDRFVVYSLGNFISAQVGRYKDGGVILQLEVEKKEDGSIVIDNINTIPVWRYVDRSDEKKNRYRLLPAQLYTEGDPPENIPEDSLKELLTFLEDSLGMYPESKTPKIR